MILPYLLSLFTGTLTRARRALRGTGSLEDNLILLGMFGGGLFVLLVVTLVWVQRGLDSTQQQLAEQALPAEERITGLATALEGAFHRQGQISSTVRLEELEPLRDRTLVEGRLLDASRAIVRDLAQSGQEPQGELGQLEGHVDGFLAADDALFTAIEQRHRLQAAFELELEVTEKNIKGLVDEAQAVNGMLRLQYVVFLRQMLTASGHGAVPASAVVHGQMGQARLARQLTVDLSTEMLAFGWLVSRIHMASTSDMVNAMAANELPQSKGRILRTLAALETVLGPKSEERLRTQGIARQFVEIAPQVMDEKLDNSLVSLRRRVIAEAARAASVRDASQHAAQQVETDAELLQHQVSGLVRESVRRAAIMRTSARLFSILVVAFGVIVCLIAVRRIGQDIVSLRATNRDLTRLKEDLTALNASLDRRVAERTHELSQANERLGESLDKLAKTQQELVRASRLAGMADVATGVLHNVGNVLNSVNVSAGLVTDRVKQSKVSSLSKVNEMLRAHQADLGTFLTLDDRGKRVPQFLEKLAEQLVTEQQGVVAELSDLQKNIDHIKTVVARQQSHAKGAGGVLEQIELNELAEESIRMSLITLEERNGVQLQRDFCASVPVTTDRHKVSQILVNLVTNAKHAVRDFDSPQKLITVRTAVEGESFVLAVKDTGCGIKPENLARIFNHGFTTKRDGHGFGLHSAACAAGELGGTLNVHSDGPGAGATFTLKLPIKRSAGLAAVAQGGTDVRQDKAA